MSDDILKNIQNRGSSQKGKGSAWLNPKEDPQYKERWTEENIREYKTAAYKRISELLISKWSLIEPHINGSGFEALQKTYRDGKLEKGKDSEEMMVIYQSEADIKQKDSKVENSLFTWLDFMDVNQINLRVSTIQEVNNGDTLDPPNLILFAEGKTDLNINQLMGTLSLDDIELKDGMSQFMKLDSTTTNINRGKLSEHVDTEFGELQPLTFTQFLERYSTLKKQIPLRYRSDDFFKEYSNSKLPIEYRVEKLFEEFEKIKNQIPCGRLTPYNEIELPGFGNLTDKDLFGWETLTYLISNSQTFCGTTNPIFSQEDAHSWLSIINGLKADKQVLSTDIDVKNERIKYLEDYIASLTTDIEDEDLQPVYGCTDSNAINYDYMADIDDASCEYAPMAEAPVSGCTDEAALNYDSSATQDDGTCKYPKVAFSETFDSFQDTYSPSNYWWRSNLAQVVQTDGPDGSGDGAIRIYRKNSRYSWPGALYGRNNDSPLTIEEFNIDNRKPKLLWLQEGRTYKISVWGRCQTWDDHAMVFIGDTRCPGGYSSGCYSWTSSRSWNTNPNNSPNEIGWVQKEWTFTPSKNKHLGSGEYPQFPGVMGNIYLYPGTTNGAGPGQFCDYANIEIKELSASGGLLQQGGPVTSVNYPGPQTEVNPDIILPTRKFDLDIPKPYTRPKKKFQRGGRTKPKPKIKRRINKRGN